ncbi:MAG TPA: MFS transporter, partial [Mycobacteriales bacterium]|nr:MFS transporter [Mycobacteriales bacterium]
MDELTRAGRLRVLAICCMSLLIVGMDNSIVNVALPSIHRQLHASVSGLQWTVDAYTLVLGSLLLLAGSTADRLGRRRTFQTGLVVFVTGSLLCSLAPSLGWLVAFRMVQAVGGSMLNPVAMSIITNVFTDPKERARAIGVWGAMSGLSIGLGPLVGGALTDSLGWRAIFWVNVPVGIVALLLAARYIPESRALRARAVDPVGQALILVVLADLIYAIIDAPRAGLLSVGCGGCFLISAAALLGFVLYERRHSEPLIDLRFFRSVPFSGATVIAVCSLSAFAGFLFLNTLYLQEVRGFSALHAGLFTLPLAGAVLVSAPLSGRRVAIRGPRPSLLIAGTALCLGAALLIGLSDTTSLVWVAASYVIFGIGFGTVNAPITNTAVSGMPLSQAGTAAAVASTSRQTGMSLGVAIIGSIVNSGTGNVIGSHLTAASHGAYIVIA